MYELFSCRGNPFTQQFFYIGLYSENINYGAQLLSGRVLDLRIRGRGFEPHRGASLRCGP